MFPKMLLNYDDIKIRLPMKANKIYKEIINSSEESIIVKIPKHLVNKKLELLIYSVEDDFNISKNDIVSETAGLLKDNFDPVKWQNQLRDEWERN